MAQAKEVPLQLPISGCKDRKSYPGNGKVKSSTGRFPPLAKATSLYTCSRHAPDNTAGLRRESNSEAEYAITAMKADIVASRVRVPPLSTNNGKNPNWRHTEDTFPKGSNPFSRPFQGITNRPVFINSIFY